jgi:hypothetical protein
MNVCSHEAITSNTCATCGIPWDAGYFDESRIIDLRVRPLEIGEELTLVSYQLHRNYCGILLGFAQFTDQYAQNNSQILTAGYQWQVRVNGRPRDPYLTLDHILNPWGQTDQPIRLRLEESGLVEMVLSRSGPLASDSDNNPLIRFVGGRITGRYWYNTDFGGRPNRL